jgi:hypothetical protein
MKKYSLLVYALLLTFGVYGQSIFERYAENDEVTLVSISPKMFKMLGQMSINLDDPEAQEYLDMVTSINNFKVLISSNQEISGDMLEWVNLQVSKNGMEQLMSVKDPEANVTFYVKDGKREDHVEQLLMYVKENIKTSTNKIEFNGRSIEAVLMLLEGDIDLNKISKLTDQMDLPGGKQLKKAQKKKSL